MLNNFYKETTPNPHLHIHVRPRYKNAVVINDHSYDDTEFAHHYALKKDSLLLDDDRQTLYALMKKNFTCQLPICRFALRENNKFNEVRK